MDREEKQAAHLFCLFGPPLFPQVGVLEPHHVGGAEARKRVAQPPRFAVRVRATISNERSLPRMPPACAAVDSASRLFVLFFVPLVSCAVVVRFFKFGCV